MSETRKIAAILRILGCGRPATARRRGRRSNSARCALLRSDLIDPTISVHHGRIVKRTGDGSVIEFRSVVDAVRCALEVQHAMVERNAGVALDKRIEFRIGIHLGDVVEGDGDPDGRRRQYRRAAGGRLHGGARSRLSEDAYRQVKGQNSTSRRERSRPDPTQEHRRADAGVFNRVRHPRGHKARSGKSGNPHKPAGVEKASAAPPPLFVALAALLVLIGGGAWWFLNANRPAAVASQAPAEAARISIVVLPFTNLSNDPAQDYFADGVTENLTTELLSASTTVSSSPAIPPSPSRAKTSTPRPSARSLASC